MVNILLSFLSFVRVNEKEIDIIGNAESDGVEKTSDDNTPKKSVKVKEINKIEYAALDEIDKLGLTYTTNESGLRYVLQNIKKGEKLDGYVVLVSQKVKDGIVETTDKTHMAFIKDRTEEILSADFYKDKKPEKDIFKPVPFDEGAGTEETIKTVLDTTSKIEAVSKGENVNLYIDISGGLRDASILLLITSRILECFDNIIVKDVIYSKLGPTYKTGTIEKHKRMFDLLTLVAGVEEFVTFGSVRSLEKYLATVQDEITPEIKATIEAMRNFSEKMQLCRSTDFEEAINELDEALKEFANCFAKKQDEKRNITEKLFDTLYKKIFDKYDALFAKGQSRSEKKVSQFRWCLNNGYLQQAMTLITEQTPQIYFDAENPILRFNDKNKENEINEKWKIEEDAKRGDKLDFPSWLMFRYNYSEKENVFEMERKKILAEIDAASKKSSFTSEIGEKLIAKLIELKKEKPKNQEKGKHASEKEKNRPFESVDEVIKEINKTIRKHLELVLTKKAEYNRIEFEKDLKICVERAKWLGYFNRGQLLNNIEVFLNWYNSDKEIDAFISPTDTEIMPIMEYLKTEYRLKEEYSEESHQKKRLEPKKEFVNQFLWNKRTNNAKVFFKAEKIKGSYSAIFNVPFVIYPGNASNLLKMLKNNILSSENPSIIRNVVSYYEIKDERNATNHANINRTYSTDYNALKKKIDRFICGLEKINGNVKLSHL